MKSRRDSFPPIGLEAPQAALISRSLLGWFEKNQRPMPWRATRDPYRIWISEVMLQQTQVATVIPYYERFISRFPTVSDLARAPLDDLLKQWEGLGYYTRARNLLKAAQAIVNDHRSTFPPDFEAIRSLPGIGAYTAGAIASIAFNLSYPAVDGNVFRVLARLFAIEDDVTLPQARRRFEDLAARLIPEGEAWRFNQALMELGATVCTPAQPRCGSCPVGDRCAGLAEGKATLLPIKSKKAPPKEVTFGVGVVRDSHGRLLITRRPQDGLLGGLWEFPTFEVDADPLSGILTGLRDRYELDLTEPTLLASVPHQFTHRRAVFEAYQAKVAPGSSVPADRDGLRWVADKELDGFALPLAQTKIRQALEKPVQMALGLPPVL